jgi:hypothetical protein
MPERRKHAADIVQIEWTEERRGPPPAAQERYKPARSHCPKRGQPTGASTGLSNTTEQIGPYQSGQEKRGMENCAHDAPEENIRLGTNGAISHEISEYTSRHPCSTVL